MNTVTAAPHIGEELLATWVARVGSTLEVLSSKGPVSTATEGSSAAVFDGVLYNRDELERDLGPQPNEAAVVLKGYERWGLEVLQRIKGIYGLVIRDGEHDVAVLARDPLGMNPIFYAERDGELLVSSSIEPLLECDGVSRTLNRGALADHMIQRWPDREETYFEAVRRVPPGHALVIERGARRLYRHWDPAPPGEEMNWVAEDELERFHDLFDQAVNRCLALGPTAIYLSGGLDSVSVAGAAVDNCRAQGLPEPLALSLVFPHPECNEELQQRAVARTLGLDQVLLGLDDVIGERGLLLSSCDRQPGKQAPVLNHYGAGYTRLAERAAARGARGVLTGNGGDEWLCVTPLYAADLLRSLDFGGLVRHADAFRRSFNRSSVGVWRDILWTFGARRLLGSAAGATLRALAPGVLHAHRMRVVKSRVPDWVAPDPALKRELYDRGLASWPERPTDGYYRHDLRFGLDHGITSLEMEEYYESARETGVRVLSPFLDAELVDFLYRVPPDLLNRGGRSKGLVRDELARRFPEVGFDRHKKVSAFSYGRDVVMREGERTWKELGGVPALAELGVIDADAFERMLPVFLSEDSREWGTVTHVLTLEAWTQSRI
jgi:asparagine synthase (glutamine-hydrolysing)